MMCLIFFLWWRQWASVEVWSCIKSSTKYQLMCTSFKTNPCWLFHFIVGKIIKSKFIQEFCCNHSAHCILHHIVWQFITYYLYLGSFLTLNVAVFRHESESSFLSCRSSVVILLPLNPPVLFVFQCPVPSFTRYLVPATCSAWPAWTQTRCPL